MGGWVERFRAQYRYVRVSRASGEELEQLHNVLTGGTLERNLDTDIKESGSIEVAGRLDIGGDLLRVYLDASFVDGTSETVCLGTFLPAVQRSSLGLGVEKQSVQLSGRLQELQDMQFVEPFQVPAGTNLVDEAKRLCTEVGLVVETDQSDLTASDSLFYGVQADSQEEAASESTRLSVVNDLLQRANFDTARTDTWGTVLMRRTTAIANRSIVWEFREGETARFLSEFEDNTETSGIANVFYAVYTGAPSDDAETVVTIGKAVDDDPTSPWSTVSLGREIVQRSDYDEYTSQEEATAEAERLLTENRQKTRKLTLQHVYQPVTISDAILLDYPTAGIIETVYGVRKQTLNLSAGCLTESEIRSAAN